jgi:predicted GNAT superfamily acetyltransferase
MLTEIIIQTIDTFDEIKKVRKLEEEIWNGTPSVPEHQYFTAVKNGGLLLGAYINEELIGFSYGFPGVKNKNYFLYSHMLGIKSNYRKKGIGEQLKWRQREEAKKLGYSFICWTYDPLQSVNANINIRKLHGIVGTYYTNYYGEMNDDLNRGLPSDRFLVEWHIDSPYVETESPYVEYEDRYSLINWNLDQHGHPKIEELYPITNHDYYFVPIPCDFHSLKRNNLPLAIEWREKTRQLFIELLEKEYTAVNLLNEPNNSVCYYLFLKKQLLIL